MLLIGGGVGKSSIALTYAMAAAARVSCSGSPAADLLSAAHRYQKIPLASPWPSLLIPRHAAGHFLAKHERFSRRPTRYRPLILGCVADRIEGWRTVLADSACHRTAK
jgi:hypothetical protein